MGVFKTAVLAAALAMAPFAAAAQTDIDPYHKALIIQLHPEDIAAMESWEGAMRAHLAGLAASETLDPVGKMALARMLALLDLERLPITRDEMIGDWSFKSYQADGLGAYEYTFFDGRIYPEGEALVLDKSGGSQRHFGHLAQARVDALFFVGALSYADDPPPGSTPAWKPIPTRRAARAMRWPNSTRSARTAISWPSRRTAAISGSTRSYRDKPGALPGKVETVLRFGSATNTDLQILF